MKRAFAIVLFLTLLISTSAGALQVRGLSETIVVPDDYPTITAAISNAADGDTVLIKSGTYEGPINQTIVIDKTLTIIGENAENTVIKLYPAYSVSTILWYAYYDYSNAMDIVSEDFKLVNLNITIPALTSTPFLPGYMVVSQKGGDISATGDRIEIAGNKITTGFSVKGSYCKITDNVAVGLHLNGSFNEVSRNSFGIFVEGESNVIKDNVCTALHMSHANNNFVLENRVWSDSRDYSGIDVAWSDDNVFCRNEVSGFSYDFRLWFSSRNTIVANTIADSLAASISFGDSSSNKIYLNNFVDNPSENKPYVYDFYTDGNYRSAHPDMTLSTNSWDDGTRGNYWENFEVSDVNGDGAGEASYLINVNNQDDFPLVATVDISEVPVELPELPELPEIPELHVALPVVLLNPINTTYAVGYVSLDFVVDKRAVWTGYSLDGHANVTASENLTLEGVSDGAHTLTVYANDTFGFTGASETITFTVATFPTALVAVAVLVSAVAISAGLLLYFKKRKH